jgi:hypothetical protein
MTRQHFFMRELGWTKREARKLLREYEMAYRGQGSKTIAKIHKAERVRHCLFNAWDVARKEKP